MKYTAMVLVSAIICSLSLNSMAPDVTCWKEICKDPQKKEKLVTIYKDFCQERVKNNVIWTAGSLVPFIFKSNRINPLCGVLFGLFALRQTYLLGRNSYRYSLLVGQEDLFYLNHDVLEQLGNPIIYGYESEISAYGKGYSGFTKKGIFGYYRETGDQYVRLRVNNIYGIEAALSGKYRGF